MKQDVTAAGARRDSPEGAASQTLLLLDGFLDQASSLRFGLRCTREAWLRPIGRIDHMSRKEQHALAGAGRRHWHGGRVAGHATRGVDEGGAYSERLENLDLIANRIDGEGGGIGECLAIALRDGRRSRRR